MQQQKQTCFSSFRSKLNTANDKFVYKWNSLKGMFGGLGNFGESNLYDQNKENVKELSMWAMTYGDEKSTRDVMVQTDLGGGKTFELYFPKMYVDSFNQDFSVGNGEGYFILNLKQTVFNEENINLK